MVNNPLETNSSRVTNKSKKWQMARNEEGVALHYGNYIHDTFTSCGKD